MRVPLASKALRPPLAASTALLTQAHPCAPPPLPPARHALRSFLASDRRLCGSLSSEALEGTLGRYPDGLSFVQFQYFLKEVACQLYPLQPDGVAFATFLATSFFRQQDTASAAARRTSLEPAPKAPLAAASAEQPTTSPSAATAASAQLAAPAAAEEPAQPAARAGEAAAAEVIEATATAAAASSVAASAAPTGPAATASAVTAASAAASKPAAPSAAAVTSTAAAAAADASSPTAATSAAPSAAPSAETPSAALLPTSEVEVPVPAQKSPDYTGTILAILLPILVAIVYLRFTNPLTKAAPESGELGF